MPHRKSKSQTNKKRIPMNRELLFKDDGQEYACVIRMLGNSRCEVQCIDGAKRLARIRGKMKNTVWIKIGDYVLVGLREFQDEKCDIIHKYMDEEIRNLRSYGEIPEENVVVTKDEDDDCTFDFDDI